MLVAAVGLAGAGKTTSLEFLASIGVGVCVYAGGIVRDEVASRGLDPTPENEKAVRDALRSEHGMAVLAERAAPRIGDLLGSGACVLIDAVCNSEEASFYRRRFALALRLLAIETPFALRAERLAARSSRPLTLSQLASRDAYERETLNIDKVIADADMVAANGDTMAALFGELRKLAPALVR